MRQSFSGRRRWAGALGDTLSGHRLFCSALLVLIRTIKVCTSDGEGTFARELPWMGGGLVNTEWFKRYRDNDKPERFDRIVQSWDTANKATELSDYSVCTTWGVKGKHLFHIGLCRRRLEYPALKRAVREQQDLFNASVVLIEDKASGTQLIQDLIAEGCHRVTRYQPTDEKTMRMHAQTAVIENGFVHIPETAPWLAEYLHELAVFPNGKHDDQADSTAQFLDWFKRPFAGQGIFEPTGRRKRPTADPILGAAAGAARHRRRANLALTPAPHRRPRRHCRNVGRRC